MLQGLTALVTGGSRGIGGACARRLALAGARVVVTSRSQSEAESVAAKLHPHRSDDGEPLKHIGARCDVRRPDDVRELFQFIGAEITPDASPLAVVVNAAGVNHDALLMRMRLDQIDVRSR